MAANYWASTQRHDWQKSKANLIELRRCSEDQEHALIQQYPLPDRRLIHVYFQQQIAKLGRRLSIRQHVLATAHIFVSRYYTKQELRRTNPFLIMATAFYLACKIEECPQHIRIVLSEARNVWPDLLQPEVSKLGECEFLLISELNAHLIVHHPYRYLVEYQSTVGLTADESALCWSIINDHYVTDLPLLYPPFVIAVMAIMMTVVIRPSISKAAATAGSSSIGSPTIATPSAGIAQAMNQFHQRSQLASQTPNKVDRVLSWLANSDIDVEALVDAIQEMISLYQIWETYNERTCKEQIIRFVKARALDK